MGIAAVEGESACPPDVGSMRAEAARLIGRLASSFVELPASEDPLHMRIAGAWKCEQHADLLRKALVLLADQELTSSTFAARIAASTGASLGACALAGLAALSGRLHGDATVHVQAVLDETRRIGTENGVQLWLSRGPLPGFGHELYPQGDPRATALLGAFKPSEEILDMIAYVDRSTGLKPSIDVALVALSEHCQLPKGAAFSLFAVGRCVGWMAHCIEQSLSGSLLRPRAHYIGPEVLN